MYIWLDLNNRPKIAYNTIIQVFNEFCNSWNKIFVFLKWVYILVDFKWRVLWKFIMKEKIVYTDVTEGDNRFHWKYSFRPFSVVCPERNYVYLQLGKHLKKYA